jgi:hypothetical protein
MGSILSDLQTAISQQDRSVLLYSFFLSTLVAMIIIIWIFFLSNVKCIVKRFIRIQLHKRLIDLNFEGSDAGTFVSYYHSSLCHMQKVNSELLSKILQKNHSCTFFMDKSISLLSSSSSIKHGYTGWQIILFQGGNATISNREPNEFYTKLKRVENGVY